MSVPCMLPQDAKQGPFTFMVSVLDDDDDDDNHGVRSSAREPRRQTRVKTMLASLLKYLMQPPFVGGYVEAVWASRRPDEGAFPLAVEARWDQLDAAAHNALLALRVACRLVDAESIQQVRGVMLLLLMAVPTCMV